MSDSTSSISPAEKLKSDIRTAEFNISTLQNKVNLTYIYDQLEDIQNSSKGLPQRIQDIRRLNYIFEKNLEQKSIDLQKRWTPIQMSVRVKANQESMSLKSSLKALENEIARINSNVHNISFAQNLMAGLESKIDSLEDRISASERMLNGLYDSYHTELNQLTKHLTNLEWSYEQLNQASFKLLMEENLIMAVEATWTRDGREDKNDPRGNLFITDQRLIFEQKEEVATKKVLFITTERKLVQSLMFEVPVRYVEKIIATEQGIFKNKDFLEIHFSNKAPYQTIVLHLHGQDSDDWTEMINKILSGDYDKDRTVQIDQEVKEKIENIPTICPGCGATISFPVYRGIDHLNCEYCGYLIKL